MLWPTAAEAHFPFRRRAGNHAIVDWAANWALTNFMILTTVGCKSGQSLRFLYSPAECKFPAAQARKALKPGGVYLNVHRDAHARTGLTRLQEILELKDLLEAGHFKPVIDRVYPFEQIVEAHRYVDLGHKKGNVVITIQRP